MKIISTLILNLFFLTNCSFSQENDLPSFSKDTLGILSQLSCWNWMTNKEGSELTNTAQSEFLDNITEDSDSLIYLYSGNTIPLNKEFRMDGCRHLNVFVFQSTINKIPRCSWIEIKEIKLKKHRIRLMLILHKKANQETTTSILYEFKITQRHGKRYGKRYDWYKCKLIKKRHLKPTIQIN